MSNYYLLTIFIISGLIASLEPFVLSVYAALIAGAKGKGRSKHQQNLIGLSYIFSYGAFVALIAIALSGLMSVASEKIFFSVSMAIAVLSILWGLNRIKNYFWYKPFGRTPRYISRILHKRTMTNNSASSALILGAITAYTCVINTIVIIGGFACLTLLLRPGEGFWPLILAACLCLPLFILQWFISRGLKVSAIIRWKESNKKIMELSLGTLCVFVGWLIFICLNGILE
jgi:hypothetical protein